MVGSDVTQYFYRSNFENETAIELHLLIQTGLYVTWNNGQYPSLRAIYKQAS